MLRSGTINRHEFKLLQFADTVEDAFTRVRRGLEQLNPGPRSLIGE